ncbi:4-oxalocrotonate tautomerase [Gordonia desulfuricans]|uniref:4-oxalocrotonate tautomerase n=1 Tax=Gordonia desulfuricans TaxID=89051 RepID=A0A7K3LRN4_9ACTN|nr:tautomerase family protein [Gordonia desulfuricans]NDK90721.1 4-oxalocrotonate tautomerase [Gordonia desulfuricans]
MPVAHFHLSADTFTAEQESALLRQASKTYARVLNSPIDRVRVFLVHYPPSSIAVAGELVSDRGMVAPYFTAIVLAGRPAEQRHELLSELTSLLVEILGIDRTHVRGQIIEVSPENWGIAGEPASGVRATEIAERASTV